MRTLNNGYIFKTCWFQLRNIFLEVGLFDSCNIIWATFGEWAENKMATDFDFHKRNVLFRTWI